MAEYRKPPLHLLNEGCKATTAQRVQQQAYLQKILEDFIDANKLKVKIVDSSYNDISVVFLLVMLENEKPSRIVALKEDLSLRLGSAVEVRAEGNCITLAVLRMNRPIISIRSVMESDAYVYSTAKIPIAAGIDALSDAFILDLSKIDNLLIAGTTGSGKSTFLNNILLSIMYQTDPRDVRLITMDTKIVDLAPYNGTPHLMTPNISNPEKAFNIIDWVISEAGTRLSLFIKRGCSSLDEFNEKYPSEKLAELVIIYDEFIGHEYGLQKKENLRNLTRYTKCTGIHLILAAQTIYADTVLSSVITENVNHRVCFTMAEATYSRQAIGRPGAEELRGLGDLLYVQMDSGKYTRAQAAYSSFKEIDAVIAFLKAENHNLDFDRASGFLVEPDFVYNAI